MQLFILDFDEKQKYIKIDDRNILKQLKRVLRVKKWDSFFVQKFKRNKTVRCKVFITKIEKNCIIAKIIESEKKIIERRRGWVIVAFLNKFSKMEILVQKLTEFWVENIIFVPFERSIKKTISKTKKDRFYSIAKEAVEQSKWRLMPSIVFEKSLSDVCKNKQIYVADLDWQQIYQKIDPRSYILIWPEWWITQQDLQNIWEYKKIKLSNNILRSETAAIVWWWLIS